MLNQQEGFVSTQLLAETLLNFKNWYSNIILKKTNIIQYYKFEYNVAPHFQSFRVGNAAHAAAAGRANCVNNKPDCRRGVGQISGPVNRLQLATPEPRRRVSSLRDDRVLFTSREERFLLSNTDECSRSIPPLALMNPYASLRAARSECVVRPRTEWRRWFHSGWWWVGNGRGR